MSMLMLLIVLGAADEGTAVGPEVGKQVPSLKTVQIAGEQRGKEVNWKQESKDKPTIFIFIRSDKWDRPLARVLRLVDESVAQDRQNASPGAQVALIWVTKDVDKAKEYLPRVQQSIKLQASNWNVFEGELYDVEGWVLSGDSTINVIIAKENKIAWGRAFQNVSDSLARTIRAAYLGGKK
jgi:hypothetical protein